MFNSSNAAVIYVFLYTQLLFLYKVNLYITKIAESQISQLFLLESSSCLLSLFYIIFFAIISSYLAFLIFIVFIASSLLFFIIVRIYVVAFFSFIFMTKETMKKTRKAKGTNKKIRRHSKQFHHLCHLPIIFFIVF